jgi:hypothetical protein
LLAEVPVSADNNEMVGKEIAIGLISQQCESSNEARERRSKRAK